MTSPNSKPQEGEDETRPDEGKCAACGEPMDEYIDCLESDEAGGRHVSRAEIEAEIKKMTNDILANNPRLAFIASRKGDKP